MIKTNSPDKAASNLQFLVQTNLLTNDSTKKAIELYVAKRREGSGVSLPTVAPSSRSRGLVYCLVPGSDIKALVAELDPHFVTAMPKRWVYSADGKTASTRLLYSGGPAGFTATLTVDARDGQLSISISGASTAVDLASRAVMARFNGSDGKAAEWLEEEGG